MCDSNNDVQGDGDRRREERYGSRDRGREDRRYEDRRGSNYNETSKSPANRAFQWQGDQCTTVRQKMTKTKTDQSCLKTYHLEWTKDSVRIASDPVALN